MRAERSSWGAPSRKWAAAQTTALTALAVMWATTGEWNQEETIALIGLVSQAVLSYLLPNAEPASRDVVKSRIKERSQ